VERKVVMKIYRMRFAGVAVALIGVLFLTGCDDPPTAAEVGQKTGAALDKAADKTVEFTGKALDATGEGMKKAGSAVENTGENMQR
jgi:uncharacterized lipoprotein YajG